jgi:hypothetical protein
MVSRPLRQSASVANTDAATIRSPEWEGPLRKARVGSGALSSNRTPVVCVRCPKVMAGTFASRCCVASTSLVGVGSSRLSQDFPGEDGVVRFYQSRARFF